MTRPVETYSLILPHAAAWLFGISETRCRKLALDGKIPWRTVRGSGRRPTRGYLFDALVARWGEPDAERLALLVETTSYQMTSEGAALWHVLSAAPYVEDSTGELAVDMKD